MRQLASANRDRCIHESLESEHRVDSLFDSSVILLDLVVEIFTSLDLEHLRNSLLEKELRRFMSTFKLRPKIVDILIDLGNIRIESLSMTIIKA